MLEKFHRLCPISFRGPAPPCTHACSTEDREVGGIYFPFGRGRRTRAEINFVVLAIFQMDQDGNGLVLEEIVSECTKDLAWTNVSLI